MGTRPSKKNVKLKSEVLVVLEKVVTGLDVDDGLVPDEPVVPVLTETGIVPVQRSAVF